MSQTHTHTIHEHDYMYVATFTLLITYMYTVHMRKMALHINTDDVLDNEAT